MVMPVCGTFDYRVRAIRKSDSEEAAWIGDAITLHESEIHPGLVGYHPRLEITKGRITLWSTESVERRRSDLRLIGWPLASSVSYDVGELVGDLLEDGDELLFRRDGTGAKSLCAVRNAQLVFAFGALTGWPLPGVEAIRVEEDARTKNWNDYCLARQVRNERAHVLWLDPDKEDIAVTLVKVADLAPGRPMIVAYRNLDQRAFLEKNCLLLTDRFGSVSYAHEPQASTVEEWIEYLTQLPEQPPNDLRLHFHVASQGASRQ